MNWIINEDMAPSTTTISYKWRPNVGGRLLRKARLRKKRRDYRERILRLVFPL